MVMAFDIEFPRPHIHNNYARFNMDLHTKAGISTLLDLLQHRGSEVSGTAHKTAFTYLQDGNQISGSLTFSELDRQARSVAAHLQEVTKP